MSLENKQRLVINNPNIDPNSYNLIPHDWEACREAVIGWLPYTLTAEHEVTGVANLARLITPKRPRIVSDYIDRWEEHENLGHADSLQVLADILAIDGIPATQKTHRKMKALGLVSTTSSWVSDKDMHLFAVNGAVSEVETKMGYRIHARELLELPEPEEEIARLLLDIARQEAKHEAFFVELALSMGDSGVARFIFERLFTPIGVQKGDKKRMAQFGGTILATTGPDFSEITKPVGKTAQKIIGTRKEFFDAKYQECVDEYNLTPVTARSSMLMR